MSLLDNTFLFVHINKSGGGVITKHMKENGNVKITGKHRTLEQMLTIAKNTHKIKTKGLYVFTIVRNPWDRMLSMFLFYHKNNFNCPEFFSGNTAIDNDFKSWIRYIYSNKFDRSRNHGVINIFNYCFSNQLNWITNSQGKLMNIQIN